MATSDVRSVVLEVIAERAPQGSHLQSGGVLQEAVRRLGSRTLALDQAVLTTFHDLFRTGHLAWGYDLANPNPPFFHLTALGRQALAHHSRDPANPDGYLAHLRARAALDPITESYVTEALQTFNADCIKATAVMVGVAAESLVLRVRDALVARLQALGHTPPAALTDWKIKRVLDAVQSAITAKSASMPKPLFERFQANWPAITYQVRTARNEAGHPVSVDPVTVEQVHGSLLIFPELATLAVEIETWIKTKYA
jgi:hypothetical protein